MSHDEKNSGNLPILPPMLAGDAQAGADAPPKDQPRPPSKQDIDRGAKWIARWKDAGGGFYFFPQGSAGVMVQLAYQREEDEEDQDALDRIAPIQQELLDDDDLRSVVMDLASSAYMRKAMPAKGTA